MEKYILYARKSTDTEDKQVLSIEAQLCELRKYAEDIGLTVVDELIEKHTAKIPGRPIFNELLTRISAGEANGILAWHPDRLARNSIDGGQIVYLLDQTILNFLKFPMFQFENTSQGKFMLSIMFGQSKYYVDNLSENSKRGLRAKVRSGICPGLAPLGYLNDVRSKTIIVDKKYALLVKQAFKLYSDGDKTIKDMALFLKENGAITRGGKQFKQDKVKWILQNPFYYGHFRYNGELHEGTHEPLVSKSLWDKVQRVIKQRGHVRPTKTEPKPFCGLLKCSCGMSITAETKTKRQKNGNVHRWTYYRCSKKSKTTFCQESAVRSEMLESQLSNLLLEFSPTTEIVSYLRDRILAEETAENDKSVPVCASLREQISILTIKQKILLDSYLDQDIDRQIFVAKKNEIMSEKKSLEEKLSRLQADQNIWVEPMRKWLDRVDSIWEIASSSDLIAQKQLLAEIFGSNLILKNKNVVASNDQFPTSPQKNQSLAPLGEAKIGLWASLREVIICQQKTSLKDSNSDFYPNLAGDEGFEPPITGPEPVALPLGQSPL